MTWLIQLYNPDDKVTYDISSRTLELNINEALDSDVTTFTITAKGIYNVHLFSRVTIKRNGVTYLTGIVLNQTDNDGGVVDHKITTFECEDWGHLLTKRIVAKTYTDMFPSLIISDILDRHLPEYTYTNLQLCPILLERMKFDYVSAKEAIENVFDQLDDTWHWFLDKNKDFHMFHIYESDGTTFTKNNISLNTLRVEYTGQEHINKVWIVGRKQASSAFIEQYFTGDGTQRYFSLAYEPNFTEIYVNGVLKDSSLEANDDGTRDFLINKNEKVFYTPGYKSAFTGTIKAKYKPTKQFIDYYENNTDKATYGLMEKAVKSQDITDKLEARRYGQAEVKKKSQIKRKVSFQSRASGISLGQRCRVNIASTYWNVSGWFLITRVKKNISAEDEIIQFELEEII